MKMRVSTSTLAAAALAGLATAAHAQPSVAPGTTASLSLQAWSPSASQPIAYFNSGGDVEVEVNAGPQSIGTSPTGQEIYAEWRDVPSSGSNGNPDIVRRRFEVIFTTRDPSTPNNQAHQAPSLLQPGVEMNGTQIAFLSWNFGLSKSPQFGDWVVDPELRGSTAVTFLGYFDGRGQTPQTIRNHTPFFTLGMAEFGIDGVSDPGDIVVDTFSNTFNYIKIAYEFQYEVVPAPASLLALAGLPLLTGRRRR